ncbi:MAG TPA: alkaline shock response membrane anchor protein AmaP [Clostridia bacterium]|nr:alkaline shock response membrane anchor protein AmaP [Clostridia bacterium]
MKFRFIDKLLLVLLLLLAVALCALCLGVAMDLIPGALVQEYAGILTNGLIVNRLILGAIGLALLIVALRLFIAMGRREIAPREKAPTSALLATSENGTAYITLSALDALVQRHCRANTRIKECESAVVAMQNGVSVSLKLQVLPDTVIPELTAQLQKSLKEYIETVSGIAVVGVDILILPLAQPKAPRAI